MRNKKEKRNNALGGEPPSAWADGAVSLRFARWDAERCDRCSRSSINGTTHENQGLTVRWVTPRVCC